MRKYLLPETGSFYKANLHCHTVLSDGNKTPEEVKEAYQKLGYSIVCIILGTCHPAGAFFSIAAEKRQKISQLFSFLQKSHTLHCRHNIIQYMYLCKDTL